MLFLFFGGGGWVTLVDFTITWRTGHQHFVRGCSWYMNCIRFSDGLLVKDMGGMIWLMNWKHDGCHRLSCHGGWQTTWFVGDCCNPHRVGIWRPTAIYGNGPREIGMFHGLGKNWWHFDMQLIQYGPSVYNTFFLVQVWSKYDDQKHLAIDYTWKSYVWCRPYMKSKIPSSGVEIPPFPPTNHLFGLVFLGSQDLFPALSIPSPVTRSRRRILGGPGDQQRQHARHPQVDGIRQGSKGAASVHVDGPLLATWSAGRWRHGKSGAAGSHQ